MLDILIFFAIGFLISVPIGPTTVLAFQRNIRKGFSSGLATGFGLIITDLIYSLIAVSGSVFIIQTLKDNAILLRLIAFIVVTGVAIVVFKSKVDLTKKEETNNLSLIKSFLSVFSYSIINPASLLLFLSFIASGFINDQNKFLFPVGIFLGELSWWVLINLIFQKSRSRINSNNLQRINKVVAVLIAVLAFIYFLIGLNA